MINELKIDNKKIWALVRVSSDKQDFNSQMESINTFCRNNNINLLEQNIITTNISGFTTEIEDRTDLNTIEQLAKDNKIKLLICFNQDRLSRKTDLVEYINKLTKLGVLIVSTTEGIINDTTSDTSDLIYMIKSWVSNYESKKIKARVKNGLLAKQKAKVNYAHGKVLFGYKVENKKLVVDESKRDIIRRVFDLYIDYGTSKVIDYLASLGTYKNTQGIMQLLKNTTYKGYQRHDKQYYSEADYQEITYYNPSLAIVSESTFNKANELIKKRTRSKNKSVGYDFRSNFMFESLIYCEKCGHKLQIQYDYRPSIPRMFLQCRHCKDLKVKDTQKNWSLNKLEPVLEKAIEDILNYELDRNKLIDHYNKLKNNNINELNQLYQSKKKDLASKEKSISNANKKLELLLASTDINIDMIKIVTSTINKFKEEAQELKQDISELEQQILEQEQINQEQNEKIELFTKLASIYKLASADKQKQILNILIDKIEISNDYNYNVKIYLNY